MQKLIIYLYFNHNIIFIINNKNIIIFKVKRQNGN